MIERYSRPGMAKIWSDQSRFEIWLKVETLALEQMVREGLAPKEALAAVKDKAQFETARILEIENEVKHDVIAFLTNVAEHVGPLSRYVHRGMTSSDLLDTTLAYQLKLAGEIILTDLELALAAVKEKAIEHKFTPCIGRSHGIHAEPVTFGLKLLTWYSELLRTKERVEHALADVCVGKISGAVGTFQSVSPEVEAHVLSSLGLQIEPVSTQIVPRDRHAAFFAVLAVLASSLERFSVEIRHLQRTEVREAEEKFSSGQKGSSAMPHKRNPVLSENLSGLARLVRGYAQSALENISLWHERDISHSSVERVIAPDACILIDFMLARFTNMVKGLVVYPARMIENLNATRGLVFSGSLLLALTDAGVSREEAYRLVQQHALSAWEGGSTFEQRVRADKEIAGMLSTQVLGEVFDLNRHFRHIDRIFKRTIA